MKNPELVVLAAGMGSRYGGLKQIDPVDERGHIIIDYSIYDAIKAGFRDVTFIIKKEIEQDFCEVMNKHLAGKGVNVKYVYQELDKLPSGVSVPEGRKKPWGTAHAIACCLGTVDAPFAVINADDYYGENAFVKIYEFLKNTEILCLKLLKKNFAQMVVRHIFVSVSVERIAIHTTFATVEMAIILLLPTKIWKSPKNFLLKN